MQYCKMATINDKKELNSYVQCECMMDTWKVCSVPIVCHGIPTVVVFFTLVENWKSTVASVQ